MTETVVLLIGEEPIQRYFNIGDRSRETVSMIVDNTNVYEFDTPEEAEAFRFGICAVNSATTKDFCELSPQGYKNILEMHKEGCVTSGCHFPHKLHEESLYGL